MTLSGDFLKGSEVAALAASECREGFGAVSIPLPVRRAGAVRAAFLVYGTPVLEGIERIYPPHEIVEVDPRTGDKSTRPCAPRDFGLDGSPDEGVDGFGLQVSAGEFWDLFHRFHELLPQVWRAFESGDKRLDSETLAIVREHDGIFRRIAYVPLLPYFEHLGAEYFAWASLVS